MPDTFQSKQHYLSPVDHILPPVYTSFCLAFRTTRFRESQSILTEGVQKLVSLIPWISGEIVRCTNNGLLSIQASTGVEEIPMITFSTDGSLSLKQVARAGTSTGVEERRLLRKLTPLPLFPSFAVPVYVVRFKATMLRDGVVLAMSAFHSAFDAAGAGHLMRHLAECCHGANPQGCLDDKGLRQDVWAIAASNPSKQLRVTDPRPVFARAAEKFEGDLEALAQKTMVSCLTILGARLAGLKGACNALLNARLGPNSASPVQFLSSHDILAGLITRVIHPNPKVLDGASDVRVAVNLRDQLTPWWASGYIGNFITLVPAPQSPNPTDKDVATAQRLITETNRRNILAIDLAIVYHNTCSIRQGISTVNNGYIRRYISWLASHTDLRSLD
ncbi:hypothetical protein BJY00DRAFT_318935 [Aspergillus carlsbadensis]|nr:hypothetical protein BJY00DRAFT_318935 [Aspergillus carlsbadensis]